MVTDTIATAKQGDPFEGGHHLRSCRHQVAARHGHGSCGLRSRRGGSATTGGRAADVPVDYLLGPTVVAGVTLTCALHAKGSANSTGLAMSTGSKASRPT